MSEKTELLQGIAILVVAFFIGCSVGAAVFSMSLKWQLPAVPLEARVEALERVVFHYFPPANECRVCHYRKGVKNHGTSSK